MPSPQNSLGDLAPCRPGPKNLARSLRGVIRTMAFQRLRSVKRDWIECAFFVRLFTANSYFRA